jgi:hypothetical protein
MEKQRGDGAFFFCRLSGSVAADKFDPKFDNVRQILIRVMYFLL